MLKNIIKRSFRRSFFLNHENDRFISNLSCFYHPDGTFPNIPLPIHDSEYYVFPEGDQPLNLFVPKPSELDYDDIIENIRIRINNTMEDSQRILHKTSEIDLFFFSRQTIQKIKEIPNKIFNTNYVIYSEGTIEKLIKSMKNKVSNVNIKMPEGNELPSQLIEAWKNVKEKSRVWQDTIATKLQEFQNRINKDTEKK